MSLVLRARHNKIVLSSLCHHLSQAPSSPSRALSSAASTPIDSTSRPLLFRLGSTTSPCFDRVRDLDIPVAPDRDAWVVESGASLGRGLQVVNDRGSHWIIQPTESMPLEIFVEKLSALDSRAVKHPAQASPSARPQSALTYSNHDSKATRFVFDALTDVVNEGIAIDGWDDDDYDYVAVLANALEYNGVSLSSLVWDPNGAKGWTKEMAFVARAVDAYMKHAVAQAKGDEDKEGDIGNDHALLRLVLKLDGEKNLLSALSQSRSDS
ncbi:hypothetical protein EXIGLDRAFT_607710 [Exidia glandulosa HHB12029]|uniref:Uncharacterized protein n=1 Tax=Exidia glandulosa HHB12029 TaxID=1314781 RepID=A0A165LE48_EXIGL|nr:hypothetical protein EXIGLDRAFT_607710 [Exidia glandulosa HHB12029]